MAVQKKTPTKKTKTKVESKGKGRVKGITVNVYGIKGDKTGTVAWPNFPHAEKTPPSLLAQAIRVYQGNLHQGTVSTKTRGEVTGSTRKIYRQKGTGRARHGDIKAPIFVGGGITFGPRPRSVKRRLPGKMRHLVYKTLLYEKAKTGKLFVISDINQASGKTKEMMELLTGLGLRDKSTLVVVESTQKKAMQGFGNLKTAEIVTSDSFSPLSVLKNEALLVSQESLKKISRLYV